MLEGRLGRIVDRRAADSDDVRLARRIVLRKDRGDRGAFEEGVAVIAAFVAGSGEDGLALRCCLLEEEVLRLEHARLSLLYRRSQSPQLELTVWSTSLLTIAAYSSSTPKVVLGAS